MIEVLNSDIARPAQPAPEGDNLALQHRLDLCHLEDAGELKTVLNNKKVDIQPIRDQSNVTKDIPDLSVFAKQREKKSSEAVVEFVSPYQRYVLLAPYLRSLETPETSDQPASEDVRLDSIRQHFDKLTEMTPTQASKKEAEVESDEGVLETSEEEEVVEPKPKKPYFQESNERVKKLRDGVQPANNKKNNKKKNKRSRRKSERSEAVSEAPREFDYNQVNFKQFGAKKPQDSQDFSPNASENQNNKKGGGGRKKQQFQKRGSKSFTYKKS